MKNSSLHTQLEQCYEKLGYIKDNSLWPTSFQWRPDLRLKKGKENLAFLIRETNEISENWFQRMSATRSKRKILYNYIVFRKKPTTSTLAIANSYGIGVLVLIGKEFITILASRNFGQYVSPKVRIVKRPKQMEKTKIFISSHQVIPERSISVKLIKRIEREDNFPIYPVLVEDDPRWGGSTSETLSAIKDNLESSHWFVGILAEEFREWVEKEFKLQYLNILNTERYYYVCQNKPRYFTSMAETIRLVEKK